MNMRTADQAKAELRRTGVSVTEWSKAHKLNPGIVFQVLNGKVKGHRGESHRAAVLLGIKAGVIVQEAGTALEPGSTREGRRA